VPFDIDKLRRFRLRGFQIGATMKYETYGLSDDEESGDSGDCDPEITKYIISLMKLNNYPIHQLYDSDPGSNSD
jgi:hypothetical protein